ncbi:MAG: hypothetical protein IT317_23625 [Anaerolineales bacterium]|nr:hypothetical protein [Anaerolineales bacterium]
MLNLMEVGGGQVAYTAQADMARLTVPPTDARRYANAQLDDYHTLGADGRLRRAPWASQPPVRLALRARASHAAPPGTLGFGFWNEPFSVTGAVRGAPSVAWFFYASPPSDMALVPGVPGHGWKAATLNVGRWPGLLVAPAALAAVGLTKIPGLGRPILDLARRFTRAHEAPLPDVALTDWHAYTLDWQRDAAVFTVDGVERLRAPTPPRGPLGLVIWIDNQYAVASLEGRFGFGVLPVPEAQWLEIADLRMTPG